VIDEGLAADVAAAMSLKTVLRDGGKRYIR